jgi:DNA-directed RNA polymerase subunit H (RpoH/RPB5)
MSLQIYPPIVIYKNIINNFFKYRKFTLLDKVILSDDNIISNMEKFGFIKIYGLNSYNPRGKRNKIIIIIIKNNDNNNLELKKIKKIIEDVGNETITKNNTLDELFIIVNKDFFDKKNFNDIIKELVDKQHGGPDPEGIAPFYTICPYHNFIFCVPKSNMVCPHEVMTKDEVNALLQENRIFIKDLPIILASDPNIIWNGGRETQVVRILRKSEASLESVYYRRIEKRVY